MSERPNSGIECTDHVDAPKTLHWPYLISIGRFGCRKLDSTFEIGDFMTGRFLMVFTKGNESENRKWSVSFLRGSRICLYRVCRLTMDPFGCSDTHLPLPSLFGPSKSRFSIFIHFCTNHFDDSGFAWCIVHCFCVSRIVVEWLRESSEAGFEHSKLVGKLAVC